jgi:hypothetical protein
LGGGQKEYQEQGKMKIKILASASRDLMEGYRFYERQAEGVGGVSSDLRVTG